MIVLKCWQLRAGDVAAAMEARRAFERLLARIATPASDIRGAELIFGELVANGLEHGEGTVTLTLYRDGADAILSVHDEGGWSAPPSMGGVPLPMQERGRGLFFVRSAARRIAPSEDGRQTRVLLPVELK